MTERIAAPDGPSGLLYRADFGCLVEALQHAGYRVIGPVVEENAIAYREIESVVDLPEGWGSRQDAGRYRLERRSDSALFGYIAGVQSWKRHLFQPERTLWRAARSAEGFALEEPTKNMPRYAFLGVRACEIAAMELQDRVFIQSEHPDPDYTARLQAALVIAMQCTEVGDTCFCTSMEPARLFRGGSTSS